MKTTRLFVFLLTLVCLPLLGLSCGNDEDDTTTEPTPEPTPVVTVVPTAEPTPTETTYNAQGQVSFIVRDADGHLLSVPDPRQTQEDGETPIED